MSAKKPEAGKTAAQKPEETEKPAENAPAAEAEKQAEKDVPAAEEQESETATLPTAPAEKPKAEKPAETEPEAEEPNQIKSGFARVQIKDFRGSWNGYQFDDDGRCERISKDALDELGKQFPGAKVIEFEPVD